ncbi:hypothetical protein GCM10025862_22540 [Arsenicicoccus piscis]|uniref:DUF559 domain-containing protein n=1 Tax=Arsenicicoccus piscis TaxID=673954 RepID=A0ABQ6HP44_9MICO|nr:hypothetical protein GCM10025862_22540 [Arsenicicoccus piscis]
MEALGWVATRAQLDARWPRRWIRRAVADGVLVRVARGRYAHGRLNQHRQVAAAHGGVVSHTSAALRWGLAVKAEPITPWITVARTYRLRRRPDEQLRASYRSLRPDEIDRQTASTTVLRTVLDCARDLPFDEALCIADSALREGLLESRDLRSAAATLQGKGAARARRVARLASGLSANPMESVLRAIAIELGLALTPQLQVCEDGLFARVDLGDETLRLAVEAEGFAWHGERRQLERDARRYDLLVVFGWTVLRFSWEQIMHHPELVRWCLQHWRGVHRGLVPPSPPRLAG